MSVRQLADDLAGEVLELSKGSQDNTKEISRIVEKALLSVMKDSLNSCVETVNLCCSADQDLAHKIREELGQKEKALVSNLMSMR